MLHPDTELRTISPEIGYGVFATSDIPMGTIVYVKDAMEIIVNENDLIHSDKKYRGYIEKYSYTEADGSKVLSWDMAKYVNHSCDSNTLSTGYGFEIAIRNIYKGEQITDDYGMLNIEQAMHCDCCSPHCRHHIGLNDFSRFSLDWDRKVKSALACFIQVKQPLSGYLSADIYGLLESYFNNQSDYRSVCTLERKIIQNDVA